MAGKYSDLEHRKVYEKIWYDKDTQKIGSRSKMARIIYMTNIGPIPDTSGIVVKMGDDIIGIIDEAFLERLKKGDVFVLGGSAYEFKYSRGMTAQVSTALGKPPSVPSWFSEQLPLSYDLALQIQKFRKYMDDMLLNQNKTKKDVLDFIDDYLYVDKNGAQAIYEYFKEQFYFAKIPSHRRLLVEHYNDGRKRYIVFHTLFGRRTNDVLSRAVAYAISKKEHKDVEIGISDNGFYISSSNKMHAVAALRSIRSEDLRIIMENALEHTEVLKRRFRHVASRALMILRNYKGNQKTVGRQQMSSHLLISSVKKIDPNFAILQEARREVLEDLMDVEHAQEVINYIENNSMKVEEIFTDIPTPFAFNLIMQGYADILKMEDKLEFLKRMHNSVLAKIGLGSKDKNSEDKTDMKKMRDQFLMEKAVDQTPSFDQRLLIEQLSQTDVPAKTKATIRSLIMGEPITEIGHSLFDNIQKNQDNIAKKWPKQLAKFIIKKKSEFFKEDFDYNRYWQSEDTDEDYLEQEEDRDKAELKYDFDKASRKVQLESTLRYEGLRLIEGEREGYSKEFKKWLDDLLDGTVPHIWSTKLVKFFKKMRNEI
mgnify:FL=1